VTAAGPEKAAVAAGWLRRALLVAVALWTDRAVVLGRN